MAGAARGSGATRGPAGAKIAFAAALEIATKRVNATMQFFGCISATLS